MCELFNTVNYFTRNIFTSLNNTRKKVKKIKKIKYYLKLFMKNEKYPKEKCVLLVSFACNNIELSLNVRKCLSSRKMVGVTRLELVTSTMSTYFYRQKTSFLYACCLLISIIGI